MIQRPIIEYSPLVTGLLYLAVAVIVYRKEVVFKLNRRFSYLCFAIAVWSLGYFAEEHLARGLNALMFWARVSHLGGALAAPLGLHFILRFCREQGRFSRGLLAAGYAMAGVVILFLFTSRLVIAEVEAYAYGYRSVWGQLYPLFALNVLYCFSLMVLFQLSALRRTVSNIERNRLRYVFSGTLIVAITTLSNFLPAFGIPVFAPGYLGAFFFTVLVLVGIYRYRLMDIRQVFARYLLLFCFWILMGFCYVAILRIFEWALPQTHPDRPRLLFHFLVIGAFVLLYIAGIHRLLPRLEKRLYPLKSDVRAMETALDMQMASADGVPQIAQALLSVTFNSIKVPAACVYLRDQDQAHAFVLHGALGEHGELPSRLQSMAASGLREAVVKEELKRDLELESLTRESQSRTQGLVQTLDRLGMEAFIPLLSGNALPGFLAFSKKRFGGVYDREDMEALKLTAGRAASRMAGLEHLAALKEKEHLARMGEMAAAVAHEIKNPLGAIQGAADRLTGETGPSADVAAMISNEARRLDRIVRSFLGYARPAEPARDRVDMVRLCERCRDLFLSERKAERFTITLVAESRPLETDMDPDFFKQIFFNIAANSLEARTDGALELRLWQEADRWHVDFEDNCMGIPDALMPRMFQPFVTTKATGTGLGMAIVRKLVERLNGNIYIESLAGKGTLLRLSFPGTRGAS